MRRDAPKPSLFLLTNTTIIRQQLHAPICLIIITHPSIHHITTHHPLARISVAPAKPSARLTWPPLLPLPPNHPHAARNTVALAETEFITCSKKSI
jgi:hypothetical protein